MPQFDISSFIVQLVWLFVSFLSFYFLFSWKYLPSWAFLLKTRKKLQSTYSVQNISFENYSLNNVIKNSKLSDTTKNRVYF
jgi:Plant ATP synthase F0